MFATALNLTALAVGLAIAAVGVRLLGRRLPGPAAGLVCGNCGAPAAALTGFTCPQCHQDVRSLGIVKPARSRPRRRNTAPLFVCAWTALILVLAMVVALAVMNRKPREYLRRDDVEQWWTNPSGLRRLRMTVVGRDRGFNNRTADRAAVELFAADGRMAELELRGPLPVRVTARDPSGRQVFADRPLDPPALGEWLAASFPNLPVQDPTDLSRGLYFSIAREIPGTLAFGTAGEGAHWFYPGPVGSRTSSDAIAAPLPLFLPASLTCWPALWLAGLVRLLPKPRPAAEGVEPPGESTA